MKVCLTVQCQCLKIELCEKSLLNYVLISLVGLGSELPSRLARYLLFQICTVPFFIKPALRCFIVMLFY